MPELPEAETIVRGLRDATLGRTIRCVEVLRGDLIASPPGEFAGKLTGRTVRDIRRRGKNLIIEVRGEGGSRGGRSATDVAAGTIFLVINLGMSGRLLLSGPGRRTDAATHPGVLIDLRDGVSLVYHDVRRFGRLAALSPSAFRAWSSSIGPEPLSRSFTAAELNAALLRSASPVRSWLLDQRRLAGVGNIYANEALHRARVHPRRPANRVGEEHGRLLHRAIRRVLREAIRAGGTTLRDYRTADGWEGSYKVALRVYAKEGAPCSRCRTKIEREVFGGRSAFFCPSCQRPGW